MWYDLVYGIMLHKTKRGPLYLAIPLPEPRGRALGFRRFVWTLDPADADTFSSAAEADRHAKRLDLRDYAVVVVPPKSTGPVNGGTPIAVAS